ncbi:glutathione biosynthesis bifunctional protein GshAB [Clostridium butyricum]|nr:glutamate--cysteine ligase [Clostridium butyricum]GEQ22004.1 glutathione biosynthesis bifunctional protein GshAB [Clostridium butyricum]
MITPPLNTPQQVYDFTNALYDISVSEIGNEYLWPQSMPSIVPNDDEIRIARYDDNEKGNIAYEYRKNLIKKYGGKRQLICGIHYNFSFDENLIRKLYKYEINVEDTKDNISYKNFKNTIYLKIARNYLRYRWLIVYLLGASNIVHKTYGCRCCMNISKEIARETFTNEGAVSYRNSDCGYRNKIELIPDYSSVENYIGSLKSFINDELIDSHKELYSAVRLKPQNVDEFMKSLLNDGIQYLEYRSIDINPFEKGGISLEDLNFLQVFNLYLLIKDESDYENWQSEATENQNSIAKYGLDNIDLIKDGIKVSKKTWSLEILNEIRNISTFLNLGKEKTIDAMIEKAKDSKLTYAYKLADVVKKKGYIDAHLELSKKYKEDSYKNRFKLQGFEDLELSTQILMKESIKRGIKTEVIDRSENFICLKKDNKTEYVRQATKTSKDTYISVLIMENKSVTKKVLRDNNIKVPDGIEVCSIEEGINAASFYENKPIVIKPKSTNFGTGISIFSEGTSKERIIEALKIAFKHDNTVLLEEFIKGKEYRFLVIDDKVEGILHRVPANVVGDGEKTIRELTEIKNKDPLRGYHYVTPLEKINLDENAELFLKVQKKTFDYVPVKDEVVYLRENSNISTGGDSIDYTDKIPEKFKKIAVQCAKAVNAKICGVDMMLEDYMDENTQYGIIELNFNPAIHIHCYPYKGIERKIGEDVLKLLGFIN